MNLAVGPLVLLSAVSIAAVAAFFSISGMTAIFAGAYWSVVVMMAALESGKLVAAGWLHANWHSERVSRIHKTYLFLAISALMAITAIGIFGFLAKGHLDQQVPADAIGIQIAQREQRIEVDRTNLSALKVRQAQLDAAVNSLITQNFVIRSQTVRGQQQQERAQIAQDVASAQQDIDRLSDELVPLKLQTTEVNAKLGPVKYVADLFGWTEPDIAVRVVILILMFSFDPLAIALVIAASISLRECLDTRKLASIPSEHSRLLMPVDDSGEPATSDQQIVLAILRRNPAVIEDVLDTVLEWHASNR